VEKILGHETVSQSLFVIASDCKERGNLLQFNVILKELIAVIAVRRH
jgi:hypothetical protein